MTEFIVRGPIVKNQLFFFAGYQGTRTRSDPTDQTGFVPSDQMLAEDFSGCPDFKDIKDSSDLDPTA
jgi:hypothetical protein